MNSRNSARNLGLALLIAIAAGLAYSNTFHVPFLFDDIARIVDEPAIRTVWPPWLAMRNSNRPFAHYTFALNYWYHAYDVVGYHAVNLCIHLAAAVVLFGLVRRSLLRCDSPYRDRATLLAFACGLTWAVHPLNTQAVTYIVQRLESLMSLAYLTTLYCFVRSRESRWSWLWTLASIAACGFGMGCKEVMATAPVVVLWYDRVFVAASWREILARRWWYYASLAATWSILAWAMLHYTVDYTGGALLKVEGLTPWTYMLTQSGVILHYLRLAFWPDAQCVYYAWPIAQSISDVWLSMAVMVSLFIATVLAIFRHPRYGFLAGCFFVLLAPTSSFIPIKDLAFEHRMYLPLATLVVLVLVASYGILARLDATGRRSGIILLACVIALASSLGVATYHRNQAYESDVTLWTDTLEKSPQNVKVWVGLGSIYAKQKKTSDAIRCFTQALAIEPTNVKANAIYAGLLTEMGDYVRAQQHLEAAFAQDIGDRDAIVNMGHLLFASGKPAEALPYLEAAVQIFPDDEELQTALIVNLSYLGEHEEALKRALENLQRRPASARAHTDLAAIQVTLGRKEEARRHCRQALELDDSVARAHATYAIALAEQDLSLAIEHLERACQLEPSSFEYQLALGNLHMNVEPSAAVEHYETAVALSPDHVETLLRLGMAHHASGATEKGLPYIERVTRLRPDLIEARELVRAMRHTIGSTAP